MLKKLFSPLLALICLLTITPLSTANTLDGDYTVTGVASNNMQLVCSCGGQAFALSPQQVSGKNVFSFNSMAPLIVQNGHCAFTPNSDQAFYDLPNCTLQSTDATPIIYANVSITAIGYHCMLPNTHGNGCQSPGWATAANVEVASTSAAADYMVTTAPTASTPDKPNLCTNYICSGKNCCNQWDGQLFKTTAGAVVITGGPDDLQANCTVQDNAENYLALRDPQSVTLNLQTVHDQFAPGHLDTTVTALCKLNVGTQDYGSLILQEINGIRVSTLTPPGHIWSTIVSVASQPRGVNFKLNTPTFTSDSDTSGNYHNLWTVSLQQLAYPGTLTVNGVPAGITLSATCNVGGASVANTIPMDFEITHELFTTDPNATINPSCKLIGNNGLLYGVIVLNALNGSRASVQHTGSNIWAAQAVVTQQPSSITGLHLSVTFAPESDRDVSATYYTQWVATLG